MVNDNTSPEERLFKIIQREKNPSPGAEKFAQKKGLAGWLKKPEAALGLLKEKLAFIVSAVKDLAKKPGSVFPKKKPELELGTVNKALSAALLIIVLFVVYYAAARYPNMSRMITAAARAQGAMQFAGREVTELEPAEYYTGDAKRRDIFSAAQRPAAQAKTASPEEKKGPAGELSLQGIVWSDAPKALIQAGKDGKLHIVKEGQVVGMTGIKVKKILRGKVILTEGEREFEL